MSRPQLPAGGWQSRCIRILPCNSGRDNFCAARYLVTGAIDGSFGGTGKLITQGWRCLRHKGNRARTATRRQIGVVGVCYDSVNTDFCLARYLPSGTLDTSFNGNGKLVSPIGPSDDSAQSVALQADGKIVVAGYCTSRRHEILRRTLPGRRAAMVSMAQAKRSPSFGASNDTAYSVATQHDGKIVVAGECHQRQC